MPLYFFHLRDGVVSLDDQGTELPDLDAARAQAVGMLGQIMRDAPQKVRPHEPWRVEVVDERGRLCLTVDLSVELTLAPAPA